VVRLGGDFNFWSGLSGEQGCEETNEWEGFHAGDCSIGGLGGEGEKIKA
jgi:hypothetical protein